MIKRKAQLLLDVSTSIFSKPAVCNGWGDGAQGVSRELCGVAVDKTVKLCYILVIPNRFLSIRSAKSVKCKPNAKCKQKG
jgi:hypothetical protein